MREGQTAFYWHGMLDRIFTVEITKLTAARVTVRILDGQCRLTDQVAPVRSFTRKQAADQLIGV